MSERDAAESYLGLSILFGVISLPFYGLGVLIDDFSVPISVSAHTCGAIITAIAVYCLYVAYCGLAD